jgi:hypothetical protein
MLIREARGLLLEDERFEYLSDGDAETHIIRLVYRAFTDKSRDHVRTFVSDVAKTPKAHEVAFGIEHLQVKAEFDFGGVKYTKATAADTKALGIFAEEANWMTVCRIHVPGTNQARMIERGRARVDFSLRLLRTWLGGHSLPGYQLRFRIGRFYLFDGVYRGWRLPEDIAGPLEMTRPLDAQMGAEQLAALPYSGGTRAQQQAALALQWLDESRLAIEPTHRIIFLFSALEALLGDRSDGLKAPTLVFYRTTLGMATRGRFSHPSPLYYLYDKVRSAAVHGSQYPLVPKEHVDNLFSNVREALYEYLYFVDKNNLSTRSQVRTALRSSEVSEQVLQWLRENDAYGSWEDWAPS